MDTLPDDVVDIIYHFLHKKNTGQLIIQLKRVFNQVKYFSLMKEWGGRMKYNTNETIFYLMKDIEFTECYLKYPSKIKNLKV